MANIKRANTSGITKSGIAIPDVPDAPIIGAATNVGTSRAFNNGSATVAFSAANTGGIPASYTAVSTPGSLTTTGAGSPLTVTGLQSSTQYTYAVTATNATGSSAASSSTSGVTATTSPQAPTIGTPTVASGQSYTGSASVSVPFTAGATGGAAITGYTLTSSSGTTATSALSPITISDTVGTTRTYTVTATNSNGNSTASSASASITPASVPQAPTIGTVTLSGTSASIPFTANATGGAAVSTFTATSSPGGFTGTGSSPISVSGLSAGTAYTFTVTATNSQGTSSASSASNSVTPVSYFTMSWGSYYPYNVASRTGGFGVNGYTGATGSGNALVNNSGAVITNGNIRPTTLINDGTPTRNSYGIDASGNSYWITFENKTSYVISQDSSGAVRWQRKFTDPVSFNATYPTYISNGHLGRDGYFYILGNWNLSGTNYPFLTKLNPATGSSVWSKLFPSDQGAWSMAADSNGNLCVQYYNTANFIIGYNSSGTKTFQKSISAGSINSSTHGVTSDSSGNFYVVTANNSNDTVRLTKINGSGDVSWARSIAVTNNPGGKNVYWIQGDTALTTDSSDNIYLTHNSNHPQMGGCVIKFDSSGNTVWKRRLHMIVFANGGALYNYSISVDSTNGLMYLAGQTIFGNPYGNIGYVFKLPTDGSKTGTYDITGIGQTIGYVDSGVLTVSTATTTTTTTTQSTPSANAGPLNEASSLSFTTTSDFNGTSATVITI
jgi:hypothetical protein